MLDKVIKEVYKRREEKGYKLVYWAIDLHGVCIKSNYDEGFELINDKVVPVLKYISSLPETIIIFWTSSYESEVREVVRHFKSLGIVINYLNINPLEKDTNLADFSKKFYFNILLDDKAGFNPDTDWDLIYKTLKQIKNEFHSAD